MELWNLQVNEWTLRQIILSEGSQTQKDKYCMQIPFYVNMFIDLDIALVQYL